MACKALVVGAEFGGCDRLKFTGAAVCLAEAGWGRALLALTIGGEADP